MSNWWLAVAFIVTLIACEVVDRIIRYKTKKQQFFDEIDAYRLEKEVNDND